MALNVFQGRPMPPPNQKYRAELMNFPCPIPQSCKGSVVQKLLLKLDKIYSVLLKLTEAVLVAAQTNR